METGLYLDFSNSSSLLKIGQISASFYSAGTQALSITVLISRAMAIAKTEAPSCKTLETWLNSSWAATHSFLIAAMLGWTLMSTATLESLSCSSPTFWIREIVVEDLSHFLLVSYKYTILLKVIGPFIVTSFTMDKGLNCMPESFWITFGTVNLHQKIVFLLSVLFREGL